MSLFRPPSERAITDGRLSIRIGAVHRRGRQSDGARRVHLDLRDEGIWVASGSSG